VAVYIQKLILDVLAGVTKVYYITRTFIVLIIIYLIIQVLNEGSTKLNDYLHKIHDEKISNNLNLYIINKSSNMDLKFFDSPNYYDKIKLLRLNSNAVNQIIWNLVDCISYIIALFTTFIILVQFNPIYSCIIVLSYLPIAVCDQIYIRKLYDWQVKSTGDERKYEYIASLVSQKIHAKDIRIFGIAEYLIDIYKSLWESWFYKKKRIVKKWSLITIILSSIPQLLTVFILLQVGINIINGINSIGDFSFYSGVIGQLAASVFLIIFSISNISENKIRIKDFREFSGWANSVENTGEIELQSIENIRFCNVSFIYPGNENTTIKNLNLEIAAKERVALVGINGAGKTTLIKLLLRFYDVTEGSILINGIDIKRFTPASIRKFFSVMFQDYANYAFTLRDNITISDIKKQSTDNYIIEACKKSGVDEIYKDWEKGLDSYIYKEFETDGKELSGGENQKVSLGRTFFRDAEILILDEPSSSLDPEAEYKLFKKMIELSKDKGVILISHRLSNVMLAERILVIEGGTLIEQGSHSELIKSNGRYAALFRCQAERYNA
jgi:ABC-type multidrug transport system fused ATPase/permease subunit